jgi:pimeloyl-ACP methyl ester carboxylesterase
LIQKTATLWVFLWCATLTIAQKSNFPQLPGYITDSVTVQGETYRFVRYHKNLKDKKPKKLLLFCQGSLPIPLLPVQQGATYGPFPFNTAIFDEEYILLCISKPGIPVQTDKVDNKFEYKPGGHLTAEYIEKDYLDYYVRAANKVIHYALKQPWSKKTGIVLLGHSQGYRVAARIARKCKHISKVVLASANPYGRYHSMLGNLRVKSPGSAEATETLLSDYEALYNNYTEFVQNRKNKKYVKQNPEFKNWMSFNHPPAIEDLLQINIPILIIYGTKDPASHDNDRLPMIFAEYEKKNLTLKIYPGWEHNFFETYPDGSPDIEMSHWDDVAGFVKSWLDKNE